MYRRQCWLCPCRSKQPTVLFSFCTECSRSLSTGQQYAQGPTVSLLHLAEVPLALPVAGSRTQALALTCPP